MEKWIKRPQTRRGVIVIRIFILIIFFSYSLEAQEKYVEFPKETKIKAGNGFDSVAIYNLLDGPLLSKAILMKKGKINPLLEITLGIDALEFVSGKKIFYKDFKTCDKIVECRREMKRLSFLTINDGYIYLKISKYEKNLGVISDGVMPLYFEIDYSYLSLNNPIVWQKYVLPLNEEKKIQDLLLIQPSLTSFLKKINQCAIDRSVECLSAISTQTLSNYLKQKILFRSLLENKVLCASYIKAYNESGDSSYFPSDELLNKADIKNNIFWDALVKALKMNTNDSYITYTLSDFNKILHVEIRNRLPFKMACGNSEDLVLYIRYENNKWVIANLKVYYFEVNDG